jgi:hypothetical protein
MKPAGSDGMLLTSAFDRAAGRLLRNKDVFIIKQERTQGKEARPQKKAGNGEFDMIGRPGRPVAARLFDTVEKRLRRAGDSCAFTQPHACGRVHPVRSS